MTTWLLWDAQDPQETADSDLYRQLIQDAYSQDPVAETDTILVWGAEAKELTDVRCDLLLGRHSIEGTDNKAVAGFVHWWRSQQTAEHDLILSDSGHNRELNVTSHISKDRITQWLKDHQV